MTTLHSTKENLTTSWTPQQSSFFSVLESSNKSIILTAVAGSGKTTTLIEGTRHLRGSILAVAFNVKTKKILEERISNVAVCKTMNGLGHGALKRLLSRNPTIDSTKTRKIIKSFLDTPEWEDLWPHFSTISGLVARAKNHGLVPNFPSPTHPPGNGLLPDIDKSWENLAAHYDLAMSPRILHICRAVLIQSITDTFQKAECDFDDQIYIPTCWGAPFDKFDNILVDEAQDLSEIQHKMLRRAIRLTGRLIAVGDQNQAIYGFRGAKNNSIQQLGETFSMEEMALTVSFRCSKAVVAEAQAIVPRIESYSEAEVGSVTTLDEWDAEIFSDGDVILCRNNAPLIKTAYKLIARGRGVHVIGRDIGAGLKRLVKSLVGEDPQIPNKDLRTALDAWFKTASSNAQAKEQLSKLQTITDKYESLEAVIEFSNTTTVSALLLSIDQLFGKESAPITLSSIHKAKGLEWPRVFFLDVFLIPSRFATKAFHENPELYEWMIQEEKNILYVGITRAQRDFTYIKSKDFEKEEPRHEI